MAIIVFEGVCFFVWYGYYEEEQELGNIFVFDVIVNVDVEQVVVIDELYEEVEEEEIEEDEFVVIIVNYELFYFICQMEMKMLAKLLEIVVEWVADWICVFENVIGYFVCLCKLNFFLGGQVQSVWVMIMGGDMDFFYL